MQKNENKNNDLLAEQDNVNVAEFYNAKNQNIQDIQVSENQNTKNAKKSANPVENDIKNNQISENSQEYSDNNLLQETDQKHEKPKIIKTIEIITGSTIFKYVLGAMIIFAICFISSLFTFNIVLVPVEVQGYSMLPTINASASGVDGETYTDIVYISSARTLSHKDIVVIKGGKTQSGKQIIKRIIATPGDTLTFKVTSTDYFDFKSYFVVDVYLNGKKLIENYTKESETKIQNTHDNPEYFSFGNKLVDALETDGEFTIKMGSDEYFVMGDNRNAYNKVGDERSNGSVDSRMFGTVKKSEIVGKVAIQVKYGQNILQAIWQSIFGVCLQIV